MKQIDETKQLRDFLYNTFLARVSRSFYLTLKIIPQQIRDTISLTYLLARITDTVVDDYSLSYYKKIYFIYLLQNEISDTSDKRNKANFEQLCSSLIKLMSDKETIEALPNCLRFFSILPAADKSFAIKVLSTLFKAFKRDTDTFTYKNKMVSFQTIAELDTYLYEIAGCVGEFWTDICFLHWPTYSKLGQEEAKKRGIEFGKALQLVNILRDLPTDLLNNRCYLPADQFSTYDIDITELTYSPEKIFPLVKYWRNQADQYLKSAKQYIRNINSLTQRYALYLPVLIAEKTLGMLNTDIYLRTRVVMKVSHFEMRIIMLKAALFSVFSKLL